MAVIKFPFTSLQQLNLDWIMQQLHKILQLLPLNGVAGDVLQRTADGAAWQPIAAVSLDIHSLDAITPPISSNDEIPVYDNDAQGNYKATVAELMDAAPVQSVNGSTGAVTLAIPTDTSDLTNTAGFVDAAGAAAAAPVQSVNGMTGHVIVSGGGGAVDSVNGQTGTVVLTASDVGALPDTYGISFDDMPVEPDCYRTSTSDVTDIHHWCRVSISDNKKFIRFAGAISFLTGATSGWKYFHFWADSNYSQFDFVHPAENIEIPLAGIPFDEDGVPVLSSADMAFHSALWVTAAGNITFGYNQLASVPANTKRIFIIPSVLIQTAP